MLMAWSMRAVNLSWGFVGPSDVGYHHRASQPTEGGGRPIHRYHPVFPAGVADYLPPLSPVAGPGQNQPPTRCATGRSHCEETERSPDGPDCANACAATPADD